MQTQPRRRKKKEAGIVRVLGTRLRRRRLALGLDLAALESAIGAPTGGLAAVELGWGDLSADLLFALSRALDVSVDYFFEDMPAIKGEQNPGIGEAEVRSLVAAYWAIRDARARRSILALARAAAEEGPPT